VLLVHVVAATSHKALQDSDVFALALVKNFFHKYTKIDSARIDERAHKFKRLEVDSRLEIAFEGKPRGFQTPSCKVFTNENPNGTVVFDVETRIVQ
jgi:urate oxidase